MNEDIKVKDYEIFATSWGESKDKDRYKMDTGNHKEVDPMEIVGADNMELSIQVQSATPDMDIPMLTENQVKIINNNSRIRERITGKSRPQQEFTR